MFKEADIRPNNREELWKEQQKDREWLFTRRDQWVTRFCPVCRQSHLSGMQTPCWIKFGFLYFKCTNCGCAYMSPCPSEELLAEFYKISKNAEYWNEEIYPNTKNARIENIELPRIGMMYNAVHSFYNTGECPSLHQGTLLEVGAGYGLFGEVIKKHINSNSMFKSYEALDPYKAENYKVTLEQFDYLENSIDVIVAFEVIEHIFDPCKFLEICGKLLKPDGLIILTCPNVEGFDIALLGDLSDTVDHEHINYFTIDSFNWLCDKRIDKRLGLKVREVTTPGQLDVELVQKKVKEVPVVRLHVNKNPLLKQILHDEKRAGNFQTFLRENNMSSSMMVVIQKEE